MVILSNYKQVLVSVSNSLNLYMIQAIAWQLKGNNWTTFACFVTAGRIQLLYPGLFV